ncbi:DUF6923 family protein [Winogradskyella wichelsiae]|uniref:DUF6923 family protein n=1 Tax=Winogradskyella wichelsiae TaxID=2697007 RepID=UPI0015CDED95|nr:gliding motility-associated C-terminal domain-containing protein [Winogradskyella wichelsiae]
MKHLYNPKSKKPFRPLMKLMFIMTLVMVNFNSFGQVLDQKIKQKQVSSEHEDITSFSKNIPASNYDDLELALRGEANVAFNCDDGFGYILTNVFSDNGRVTGLYSFDLSTNSLNLIKDPIISTTTTSQFVNAIGYNVLDNYLYGLLQRSNKVVKIDSNGDIELLTVTGLTDFDSNNYAAGDIDENGILYIYGSNKFVSIDLNPSSTNYLVANIVLQHSNAVNDMAFSPVNNKLYMLTSTNPRSLYEFNPVTNTIVNLGNVPGLESEISNSFGTSYMDSLGNMYVANNESGNTYKIATPHLGNTTATFYSNLPGVSPGDGARCPSQSIKPIANPDNICITSDITEITFNVTVNDSEGTYPIDITSAQLIDPNTSLASNSVTIADQGTFTLETNGEVTFQALPSFTGTSIEYTVLDSIGFNSNLGVITISLNDTEGPTGSDTQEFCEIDNATIADLNASGNNILWYESANAENPLDSDTVLIEGNTYYASQTSSAGCESTDRLAVSVNFSEEILLTKPEEANCVSINGTVYTIEAIFTGTPPFTASGDGQSGTFTSNTDGTTTWTSSEIESTVETYNVTISDNCGSLTLSGDSPAECLNTPFDCEDGFAYLIVNDRNSQGDFVSGLYSYDLVTDAQTLIKAPLIEDTSVPQFVNAIGYNLLDNNIYGLQQYTNNIVKIDASANVEFLPIVGPFTIGDYSSGDINEDGILVLHGEDNFVSIDLNPTSPNYLTATTLLNYPIAINDITFSPADGNIYMVTSTANRKLLRFNIASNTVDDLGSVTGLSSETTNSFGTAYMDALGNMFIANNASGNIYRIGAPHTGNLTATLYNSLIDIEPGDGARCPSQLVAPVATDDFICITSDDTEININVLENDSAGTYNLDITAVQLIDPVTSLPATSVTITGQGTFTVNSDGIVLFEALPGFYGTSIEYTITDMIGVSSLPAVITVSLNKTETPTGNEVQEFCESSEPTIADLNATGENIQWYTSETSTSPIDSSEALIDGDVYYATQTTDQGCESLERLMVTVNFTEDITLVNTETLECSENGTTYTIVATFTGTAPFTVNGMNQTGTWITNEDDTFTWTSDTISGNEDYSIEIQDVNSCNILVLSGAAAACCEFEVTCPTFEETTVACYSDLPSEISYTIEEFSALGNGDGNIGDNACGLIEITAQNSIDQGTCEQTITRTFTITSYDDTNGNGVRDESETTILNSEDCTQFIIVNDTIAPTFSVPADITLECGDDVTDLTITGDVTDEADNCATNLDATYIDNAIDGTCPGESTISRLWSLSDECGNTTSFTQIITVEDNTPPTILTDFEDTINVFCDNIPEVPSLVFEDSCSNDIAVSFNETSTQTNNADSYSITRTWTVVDDCGNEAIYTQNVNVELTNTMQATDTNRCILDSEFDLFELLSGDFAMNGSWSVVSGDAIINGSLFDPASAEVGEYTFMYSIDDQACPSNIEVNVTLDDDCVVLACGQDDVVISKTVTANGDAYNEFFTISGIEECGFVIELQIFNRWGAQIYKSNNYLNDWNGEAHSSSIGSSGKVPTGTYYYIINLKNSGLEPFAGPIYVATN